jgi:hypothetical protein
MANPNIVNVTAIYGTTYVQAVGTSATAIVSNAGGSGTVIKLDALYVGNIDTSASYKITVDLYRSSTAYNMLYQISIPAGAGLDVLSKSIYLQEGDSLRLTADTASKLQAVASGEVIS